MITPEIWYRCLECGCRMGMSPGLYYLPPCPWCGSVQLERCTDPDARHAG